MVRDFTIVKYFFQWSLLFKISETSKPIRYIFMVILDSLNVPIQLFVSLYGCFSRIKKYIRKYMYCAKFAASAIAL